ncbi:hypothetical protein VMCG_02194 [Cytospora schulzeri]|uniref:Clr5 domain-containing protein n=1 Tax=Cytospora schulzeri TaxID=448051 RepID=A0A423X0S4_9PEZI|nr:hypothetical protein VMCG_02194 [Valsa malicola]
MRPTTLNRGGRVRVKRIMRKIPQSEWELFKPEIDKLYLTEDLTQVALVDYLNTKGLRVVKRQLVNQLKKWGIKKYGKTSTQKDTDMPPMQVRNGDDISEAPDDSDLDLELANNIEGNYSSPTHVLLVVSNVVGTLLSFSSDGYSTLQSCISWFTEQISSLSSMPIQLAMLDGETDPELLSWRETTEIFLALWHRWQKSGVVRLAWAEEAKPKLGITPTELLATVSCMVLDEASDEDVEYENVDDVYEDDGDEGDETGHDESRQAKLLEYAREGARVIGGWSKEDIREVFEAAFDGRDVLHSDEVGEPVRVSEALRCIRRFVADTLAEGKGV